MRQAEIQGWLRYWDAAKMVAVDQITSLEAMETARRFCSCMRTGVFMKDGATKCDLVSTLTMWRALCNMRDGRFPEKTDD